MALAAKAKERKKPLGYNPRRSFKRNPSEADSFRTDPKSRGMLNPNDSGIYEPFGWIPDRDVKNGRIRRHSIPDEDQMEYDLFRKQKTTRKL